jgi:signal transduction histidine kinase
MRTLAGSSIGLTITRALVEAHGGHIWPESVGDGQGSTFFFTLLVAK